MAEFLKAISCWEGGKGRGLGGHADVSSTPSLGSGEMRSMSVGHVGIGRGIQSNFPDSGGQNISSAKTVGDSPDGSKTPACHRIAKDSEPRPPARSTRLVESYKEWVHMQKNEEALFSNGQAEDVAIFTFPGHPLTPVPAPAGNLKPVEHVSRKDRYLPPEPPEDKPHLGSPKANEVRSPVAVSQGGGTLEVLVISEFINPLESSPLGFDNGEDDVDTAAALSPNAATVTAAFLPGVHHPLKEPKRFNEPEPPPSLEPTLADILHHTFQLLSQRPGTFISVMPALVSILKVNLREEEDVEEVIDALCFASIRDENFRYNGVRVCAHLADELSSYRFLEHLLDRCRKEFDRGLDSVWFEGDWNLCGKVGLFIGELMIQLQAEVGQPSEILVRFVIHLLERLLCFDDEALLKCLVQLLKLTGARLNEIVKSDLSRIMTEIRQSVLLKASSRRSRELLLTVVELDARGWMKDEDLENGGGDAAGGDSLPAVSSSLLPPKETKVVDNSTDEQKVMENTSKESTRGISNGNNELDDLVEDLTEDERTGLEIAHCYEQYLCEIGEEEP